MAIFGADLLYDPRTGRGLAGVTVSVRHPTTGEPVSVSTPVVTNAKGYFPRFETVGADADLQHVTLTVEDAVQDAVAVGSVLSELSPELEARIVALEEGGGGGSGILNVSGTVDLADVAGIREVYATAPATVEGVALAAGDAAVFRYLAGAWTYMVVGEHTTWQAVPGGEEPPPGDTTAPTAGTLAVTGSGDAGTTRTLTVTGASDETALHATPYRFSTDGASTWSAYQSSNVFTTAALTAGTYQPRVMVRDAAGNTATASAADFTVAAAGPSLPFTDTFTAADATPLAGRTVSGFTWASDPNTTGAFHGITGGANTIPTIVGNRVNSSTTIHAAMIDVADPTIRVSAKLTSSGAANYAQVRLGLGNRMSADNNLDGVYINYTRNEGFKVFHKVGGSVTQLGTTYTGAGTADQTDRLMSIEWDGTTATAKVGATTIATGAVTIGAGGTKAGFYMSAHTGNSFDDFTVENL